MREETIGDSVFTKADGKRECGVGIGRSHGKAVIEERRKGDTGIAEYCKPHAAQAKRDAKAKEIRLARAQRDLADRIRRAQRERVR